MKKIYIKHTEIGDYYKVNEEGQVVPEDPTVQTVLTTLPDQPDESDNYDFEDDVFEEDKEFKELDAFFGGALSELLSDNPYSRWSSYQLLHNDKELWRRDGIRRHHIDQTLSTMRKRVRLLANPVADTASFLRNEHARVLSLFDELDNWADIALNSPRHVAADCILTKVWEKSETIDLPLGGSSWTVHSLRIHNQSYWADDDVWTWKEFWEKAYPIIEQYHKAIDYLALIRLLQQYIRRCESNPLAGFHHFIKAPTQKVCDQLPRQNQLLKSVKSEIPVGQYTSFGDLFIDPSSESTCIKALLENDGQYTLVNVDGEWNRKRGSVSVLIAWIDRLDYYNKIKPVSKRELIPLLNERFPGLNLGARGRQFGKINQIFDYYKLHFNSSLL